LRGAEQLLDSRNRLDLLEENGEEVINADGELLVPYRIVDLDDDAEALAYVISLNVHRRHIKLDERQKLIKRLLLSNPQLSDRAIAAKTNSDHKTIGKRRKEAEQGGEIPTLVAVIGRDSHKQPRKKKTSAKTATKTVSSKSASAVEATSAAITDLLNEVISDTATAMPATASRMHSDPAIAGNDICQAWHGASEEERAEFAKLFGPDVQKYMPQEDVAAVGGGGVVS
jgi:hypothetical protein